MSNSDVQVTQGESTAPSDSRAFRRALGDFVTGVTVITASAGSRQVGVTANSFASVSLDPPLVLWSLDRNSTSFDTFLAASHFGVNILSEGQDGVSSKFARSSDDKFEGVDWSSGVAGVPLLGGVVAQLECVREIELDGGDHLIMVGRVVDYRRFDREPLVFARGRYAMAVDRPEASPSVPGAADRAPGSTLLQSLLRAYEGISTRFDRHRQAEGLSLNQSRVLALLDRGDAGSVLDIMGGALLGQRAAEDSISNLLERGMAQRTPTDAYSITEAGRERSARVRHELRKIEDSLVARVPGLDIYEARGWLASLAQVALDES